MTGMLTPVELRGAVVRMLDQRRLPAEEVWLDLETPEAVAGAIRDMVVRGAPAIGISAAFGIAIGAARRCRALPDEIRSGSSDRVESR